MVNRDEMLARAETALEKVQAWLEDAAPAEREEIIYKMVHDTLEELETRFEPDSAEPATDNVQPDHESDEGIYDALPDQVVVFRLDNGGEIHARAEEDHLIVISVPGLLTMETRDSNGIWLGVHPVKQADNDLMRKNLERWGEVDSE